MITRINGENLTLSATFLIRLSFKGTVVNRTLLSFNGGGQLKSPKLAGTKIREQNN